MKTLPIQPELDNRRRVFSWHSDFDHGRGAKQRHTYTLADGAAGADLAAAVIFAPSEAVLVTDVLIMPDGSSAGVDDANTSVWTVANGATTMVTKTYNTATQPPADSVQASLGAVTANVVQGGGRVELTVTNGATANLPAVIVTVEYIPLATILPGFSVIAPDNGTVTVNDAANGILTITPSDSTAADNDEIYVYRAIEEFLFASDKPFIFYTRMKYSEANTDDANVIAGLVSGVAVNTLLDDGGGPPASYSGAVFFKADGSTVFSFETSLAGTQTTTVLQDAGGSASYREFQIEFRPLTSTLAEVIPFIDGVQCLDTNGLPVKHTLTFTGATEMAAVLGIKNGFTNAETLYVDYVQARQLR